MVSGHSSTISSQIFAWSVAISSRVKAAWFQCRAATVSCNHMQKYMWSIANICDEIKEAPFLCSNTLQMKPLCVGFLPLVPGHCAMWSESRCLSSSNVLQILINTGTSDSELPIFKQWCSQKCDRVWTNRPKCWNCGFKNLFWRYLIKYNTPSIQGSRLQNCCILYYWVGLFLHACTASVTVQFVFYLSRNQHRLKSTFTLSPSSHKQPVLVQRESRLDYMHRLRVGLR